MNDLLMQVVNLFSLRKVLKLEALSQLHDLVWIITKHTAVPQPRRSSNKSRSKIFENFSFSPSLYLVQVAKISSYSKLSHSQWLQIPVGHMEVRMMTSSGGIQEHDSFQHVICIRKVVACKIAQQPFDKINCPENCSAAIYKTILSGKLPDWTI